MYIRIIIHICHIPSFFEFTIDFNCIISYNKFIVICAL
nr:MAG TPA: hypothetical protein [Caudoviricetes sp.]DAR62215.1 MAG TPA: hypothetical protein [Caudoviricetes sp.]